MEAVILIEIPILYFATMTIFKDAYMYGTSKQIKTTTISFLAVAAVNLIVFISTTQLENFKIISDGKITTPILLPALNSISFGYISLMLLIKASMNKKIKEK
jgi:hypothetical protein